MAEMIELHFLHAGNITLDDVDPLPLVPLSITGTVTHVTDDPDVDRCVELVAGDNSITTTTLATFGATTVDGYFAANIKTSSVARQAIISWSRSSGVYSELTLHIEAGKVVGRLRKDGSDVWVVSTDAATYADGAWHRVAVSGGTAGPQLWVDGELAAATFSTGSGSNTDWMESINKTGVTYRPSRLTIGASRYNGTNNDQFVGRMTNVQITDGAATASVMSADYLDNAQPYDVIVLAGQSNMVGYDTPIDPVLDATDPRIRQWGRNAPYADTIILAADPLDNHTPAPDTVGLGLSLAKQWIADKLEVGRRVLLVPTAKTNTGFRLGDWTVSATTNMYTGAVQRTQRAVATSSGSKLIGICWQMGENDSKGTASDAAAYTSQFREMIAAFRRIVPGSYPVTHGTMAQTWVDEGGNQVDTQAQIMRMGSSIPTCIVVDGRDLPSIVDVGYNTIHYSAASARELGRRHARALSTYWDNPGDFIARRDISESPASVVLLVKADAELGTGEGGLVSNALAARKLGEADDLLENVAGVQVLNKYERGTSNKLVPTKIAKKVGGGDLTNPTAQRWAGYREQL